MFITYIEFFHKMHSKYLKRFSNKIQLMYTHINNDIKFDDSIEISKNKKKELINEFVSNNVDKELLRDLKTSIGSDTNSDVSSESFSSLNSPKNLMVSTNDFKFKDLHKLHLNDELLKQQVNDINFTSNNREKHDLKQLFKKNVHKVTNNMLQLFKPKPKKNLDSSISYDDLQKIFSGINQSCDSIINNVNSNVELVIQREDDMSYLPIVFDNDNDDKEINNTNDRDSTIDKLLKSVEDINMNTECDVINKPTTHEDNLIENIRIKIDDINNSGDKEMIKNIEGKEEEIECQMDINDDCLSEDEREIIKEENVNITIEVKEEPKIENIISEVPLKKKRTYNKKKK